VVHLALPPLRARPEDIPLLVEHFVDRFNTLDDRSVPGVSDGAMACLMTHDWPGNVRELENVIERAFIFCRQGPIKVDHLPPAVGGRSTPAPVEAPLPAGESLRRLEAAFLLQASRRNGGNRTKTARELGMHKTTLYRKMKALGIGTGDAGHSTEAS